MESQEDNKNNINDEVSVVCGMLGETTVNLIDPHFGKPVDFHGDSGFGIDVEFHGDRDFGIDVPNIEDVVTPQDDNYLIIK